ncbi:MAG: glycosyltransferase family 4 protein [Nitrospirae bacterium]|nr:glycosyltransferase family 4 protein [Nitrospirota bacterium]
MRKYRIAMVAACPFPANHGSPASVREMSWALTELGHEVHIVTYPFGQEIPVKCARIHRVPPLHVSSKITVGPSYQRIFLDFLMIIKLCQVIRREKIDLIHAHNYEGGMIGIVAKKITGKPLLYNGVNSMRDELPAYNFIRPRALAVKIADFLDHSVPKGADYVTVVSQELYTFLIERGVDPGKMTVVPAGVFPGMFDDRGDQSVRKRYGIGTRPLIVYTGTLDEFQRMDYLLKAFRVAVTDCREAILMIVVSVTKPADVEKCRRMARDLGIEDHVIITDPRPLEELPAFLSAADIAVLPRPSCPGHPVKLLNYMVAGKAIVAFRGAAKGIRHMYNGLLVEDHKWEELGKGIVTLIKDPRLAEAMGRNALSSIGWGFDWLTIAKGISVIYEGIMNRKEDGAFTINPSELYRFIRKSYYPIFDERRRQEAPVVSANRRRHGRRKKSEEITFLERRRMKYE